MVVEQPVQVKRGNKDKNSTEAQQPSSTVTLYLVQIFCSWWLKYISSPRLTVNRRVSKNYLPESALESFCREHKPDAAILCLPKEVVEELGDRLVSYGIRGFWNFSHYDIGLRHRDKGNPIVVENVHLGDSLMTLCYQVNELDED